MTRTIRAYVALAAWALWMGGFAFYFGVVVPTGGKVIGGSEQGYVTQQVTSWLNLIGLASLAILLWNAVPDRDPLLLSTWALLAALHIALFAMHWHLDGLINASKRIVIDV